GSTSGPIWTFSTVRSTGRVPLTPNSPQPTNGATSVSVSLTLTWTSAGATRYDVYFGTVNPPPSVSMRQPAATYTPSGLAPGATYDWQVIARNSAASATGPVWKFTTKSTLSGPVAAYEFSEGSGTTTADTSGHGNTGTLVVPPEWTAGKNGTGLQFNGSSTY